MMGALARWRGVSKRYAHFARQDMTLELAEGRTLGLTTAAAVSATLALQARGTSFG